MFLKKKPFKFRFWTLCTLMYEFLFFFIDESYLQPAIIKAIYVK